MRSIPKPKDIRELLQLAQARHLIAASKVAQHDRKTNQLKQGLSGKSDLTKFDFEVFALVQMTTEKKRRALSNDLAEHEAKRPALMTLAGKRYAEKQVIEKLQKQSQLDAARRRN